MCKWSTHKKTVRGHKPLFTYISTQVHSFYGSSYSEFCVSLKSNPLPVSSSFFSTYSHSGMTHSINFNVYVISEINSESRHDWISLVLRENIIPRWPWKTELGFSCPPQGGKSNSFQNIEKGGHMYIGKERQWLQHRRGGWILPGEGCCRDTSRLDRN